MQISESQAEQLLVKKFYDGGDYIPLVLNHYDERFIVDEKLKLILRVLINYYQTYSKLPKASTVDLVLQKTSEQFPDIDPTELQFTFKNITNTDEYEDKEFIKSNLLEFIKNKAIYHAIMDNLDHIEKYGDVTKCIETFQKVSTINFDVELGMDYLKDDDRFEKYKNPEEVISTGYKQLDHVLNGGLPRDGKSITVIMAQSNVGKSLFKSNLAVNYLMQGLFVVIITLEMPEIVYSKRIDAHISGENVNDMQFNADKVKDKIHSFAQLNPNAKLLIKDFPPSSINSNNIKAYIDKVNTLGRKPDIIMVDYLNIMLPNLKSLPGMYERCGEITKELRALSYVYECPVVTSCQSNRSGWDTSEIRMDQVGESAGIVHNADFILALWQVEGDREACRLNTTVIKSRYGMVGKTDEYHVNYNTLRVSDTVKTEHETESENDVVEEFVDELENM